jgi:hypothetical protein
MLISSGQEEKGRSISSQRKKILPIDEDAGSIVEKVSAAPMSVAILFPALQRLLVQSDETY